MIEFLREVLHKSDVAQIRQTNALQPFLWVDLVSFTGAAAIAKVAPSLAGLAFAVPALSVVVTLALGVFFAVRDPDRLHSENFQLKRQQMHVLQTMGGVVTDPALLSAIANPAAAAITSDESSPA